MKLKSEDKSAIRDVIGLLYRKEITRLAAMRRICAIIGTIAGGLPSPIVETSDPIFRSGLGRCTGGA